MTRASEEAHVAAQNAQDARLVGLVYVNDSDDGIRRRRAGKVATQAPRTRAATPARR